MDKTGKDVNYMSDNLFLGYKQPGPSKYDNKKDIVLNRNPSWKIVPTSGKKDWRPKKTKDPDPGTYEVSKSQKFVGKSEFIHRFAAPRGEN